jgi:hypothetical protein
MESGVLSRTVTNVVSQIAQSLFLAERACSLCFWIRKSSKMKDAHREAVNTACPRSTSSLNVQYAVPYFIATYIFIVGRYSDSLRAGRSGDRTPVRGEIFFTYPYRSWGPPSLLFKGYRVSSPRRSRRAWRCPPTPSSAEAKERVELCLYSSSGPSWPVLG